MGKPTIYEMKEPRPWWIILSIDLAIVLTVIAISALAYWYFNRADDDSYIEDHSATEAMISSLCPTVPADLKSRIAATVDSECTSSGVPVQLVLSLISRESQFNPQAISRRHNGNVAYGLMQINPGTAAHPQLLWSYSLHDLMVPEVNIHEGVIILAQYMALSKGPAEALGRYVGDQGFKSYQLDILSAAVGLYAQR